MTEPARQFTIIVESVLRSDETAVTIEELKCFCESKGATVHVESPVGTITFLPTGIRESVPRYSLGRVTHHQN